MAGPNTLPQRGNDVNFPTWYWPKQTKLCIKNLGDSRGKVTVNAGNAREEVGINGQSSLCIDRSWAGIKINVVNSGESPVQVWTE